MTSDQNSYVGPSRKQKNIWKSRDDNNDKQYNIAIQQ